MPNSFKFDSAPLWRIALKIKRLPIALGYRLDSQSIFPSLDDPCPLLAKAPFTRGATHGGRREYPSAASDYALRSSCTVAETSDKYSSGRQRFGTLSQHLADGLAKRFPVTRRMVGHEAFVAMAHRFIVSERAAVVTRLQNWEMFPSF